MKTVLSALLLAACLALPARAAPPPEGVQPEGLPLGAFLSEDELRSFLDYLRDALLAAMKGERAHMPPDLALKLAVIRQRLLKEGNAAARQLLWMLREELDQALRSLPEPPPQPPTLERTRH